jgi:hypothetical protein
MAVGRSIPALCGVFEGLIKGPCDRIAIGRLRRPERPENRPLGHRRRSCDGRFGRPLARDWRDRRIPDREASDRSQCSRQRAEEGRHYG